MIAGLSSPSPFFTSKGGTGSFYLMDTRDKAGEAFDGGKTYCLIVPANVPVRQVLVSDGLRPGNPRATNALSPHGGSSN
jgi:hypothetical protein